MRRQRGVALLVALLALVLAVVLVSTLLQQGELRQARLREQWRAEQAWQLHLGMEAWALAALKAGGRGPLASGEVLGLPGATVLGQLRDLGACFNLNALAPQGHADPAAMAGFARLLRALQLPETLAPQAADFVDADSLPLPGGAEDATYVSRTLPQRTPNRALSAPEEIRRLPAMTAEHWARLSPFVCALPPDQQLNLNVAAPELWLAVDPGLDLAAAQRLAQPDRRGLPQYEDIADVRAALAAEGALAPSLEGFAVESRYFLLESTVDADGIEFALVSLLRQAPDGAQVLARARGTQ